MGSINCVVDFFKLTHSLVGQNMFKTSCDGVDKRIFLPAASTWKMPQYIKRFKTVEFICAGKITWITKVHRQGEVKNGASFYICDNICMCT